MKNKSVLLLIIAIVFIVLSVMMMHTINDPELNNNLIERIGGYIIGLNVTVMAFALVSGWKDEN